MVAARRSLIGAHISIAGGLSRALTRADSVGAQVIQIFVTNPRGWAPGPDPAPAEVTAFRDGIAERALPVFVHAPYLINPGAPDALVAARSAAALAVAIERATLIGASGVVVHAGSAVRADRHDEALTQAGDLIRGVLDAAPDGAPRLLVEPTAGGGAALASDVASLGRYLAALDDPRVGVCLDTCHLHAAGHDLAPIGALKRTVASVTRTIGAGRIGLVHVNDSRDPCGSKRDRHASMGNGTIGIESFGELFTTPGLRGVPFVVETAEVDQAADIEVLTKLRER
ncbi:MAG: nfo [Pseudonocardiales bacterium]|nr:nfo [Pseudonocardiales bacterium]